MRLGNTVVNSLVTQHSSLTGRIGEGVRPSPTLPMHEQESTAQNLRSVYRARDLTTLNRIVRSHSSTPLQRTLPKSLTFALAHPNNPYNGSLKPPGSSTQAQSACFHTQVLPIGLNGLHPELWIFDFLYRRTEMKLTQTAKTLVCHVRPGKAIAVGQATDTFQLVTGLEPDRPRMHQHLDVFINEEEQHGKFKE